MTDTKTVETIIGLVERLAPAERRQLLRRLRAGGLLPAEVLATDRNRLRMATAVDRRTHLQTTGASPRRARTDPGTTPVPLRMAPSRASSGAKVVIGAPDDRTVQAAHPIMQPLPGQAPEQPIEILFDGGSKGNPGQGYGSYLLAWPGEKGQIVRLHFGEGVTNNEAEYDTLIAALEAVLKRLESAGAEPKSARMDIRGDSLLVINQILGEWKCNERRLQERRDRVLALLNRFRAYRLTHQPREQSVRALGH